VQQEVCDFQVIGELRADPSQLVLLGDDGECYAMDAASGEILPLEPDVAWAVDAADQVALRLEVSRDVLPS
jgi:hypothetical protein